MGLLADGDRLGCGGPDGVAKYPGCDGCGQGEQERVVHWYTKSLEDITEDQDQQVYKRGSKNWV
jgi:hypothetical protein